MRNHMYCPICEKKPSGAPEEGKCARCGREAEDRVSPDQDMDIDLPPEASSESKNTTQGSGSLPKTELNVLASRIPSFREDEDTLDFDEDFEIPDYPDDPNDVPPHPRDTDTPFDEMIWQRYEAFQREQILPWKAHTDAMTNHNRVSIFSKWFDSHIRDPILLRITGQKITTIQQLMSLHYDMYGFFIEVSMAARTLCDGLRTLSQECIKEEPMRIKLVHSTDHLRNSTTQLFEDYQDALAKQWRELMTTRDIFGGMSFIGLLSGETWFDELCPDGLEDTLPTISPIPSYIDRIEWPAQFERYLRERPTRLEAK